VVTRSFNQAGASPDMNIHVHQCRVLRHGPHRVSGDIAVEAGPALGACSAARD
jgi:hypothetical protein